MPLTKASWPMIQNTLVGGPTSVTVRIPTDYATLQDAFSALVPSAFQSGKYYDIVIQSGHALTHGLELKFGDYSNFEISSEDATVSLAVGFSPNVSGNIFDFEQCQAPVFSVFLNCGGVGGRALSYIQSTGFISSGAGADNAQLDGLYLNSGSTVTATGTTWTNCGRHGSWVTRTSRLNAENSTFSDNGNFGITVRRASFANIQGSSVNDNGSSGVVAARAYINFQGRPLADLDAEAKRNGLHGIVAERGSTVVATSCDASDNVTDNLVCLSGSTLEATDCTATGAGRNNLISGNGRVDVSRADLSGAGSDAIFAQGGACAVEAEDCDLTNATNEAIDARTGARVNANGVDGSNAGGTGILVQSGSHVSALSATFDDCGVRGVFCANATASVDSSTFRRAATQGVRAVSGSVYAQDVDARTVDGVDNTVDFVITNGGIIHANGGIGGNSTTANTLTADGILFRT
jgi:hypothetical protein